MSKQTQFSLLVFDDFHPVAMPIAAFARSIEYGPKEWNGHTYKGIGLGYSPEMFYDILSLRLGWKVSPQMEYFRLGTNKDSATTHIHVDSSCARYAAVWYLSEAPKGITAGTAFWRHNETGLDRVTIEHRKDASLMEKFDADGSKEEMWSLVGISGQKFNRVSVYPSDLFHSRYPQNAWGESADDGRIVFTCFFD